ncbi:uncharacterized protein UTRI_02032_B [Ustilago trichophora]|uniref:Transglycosylase SLT domain-containing protein n=1 Tax=Ustilago trichophora TaxID=86804 RepID=A0A5C3DXG9_9BASI|nr:uncharacterized protein UTRI_02032_B [Ustilago trichophora]
MARNETWNATLLCMLVFLLFNGDACNAAALPRMAPLKEVAMDGNTLSAPTPLPIVSTYTLYFGVGGATAAAPVSSQTSAVPTASISASSSAPARSTASSGQCSSKRKHTSARASVAASPSGSLTSSNVSGKISSSASASSASQQNSVFPTVAPATPTSNVTGQRVSARVEGVLPHNFVNQVDTLVETYHGITGRKARQVALILANQTGTPANASRAETILSNLAEAYPSNNATIEEARRNETLFDWTTLSRDNKSAGAQPVPSTNTPQTSHAEKLAPLPHKYIIQAGPSNITVLSNTAGYGPSQVRHDLHVIRAWADDLDQLATPALLDETVAAILSASARYFPELSTRDAARVIMADIKAESDFDPDQVSGGRLDSGSSWGLMQVSPFGSAELKLFQQHATVKHNTYSWDQQYNVTTTPDTFGARALLDWETGKVLDLKSLTNDDLFRPWVNVHVATWIQSNLARTSSQDPYTWPDVYQKSNAARNLANDKAAWSAVDQALVGAGLPRTCLTGLGSWVAGPAVDGYGSYTQKGDDISKPYFQNIAQGLSVLYGKTVTPDWMNTLTLHAGLVDFH